MGTGTMESLRQLMGMVKGKERKKVTLHRKVLLLE